MTETSGQLPVARSETCSPHRTTNGHKHVSKDLPSSRRDARCTSMKLKLTEVSSPSRLSAVSEKC